MSIEEILVHIDAELQRLQKARDVLAGVTASPKWKGRRKSRRTGAAPKTSQTVAYSNPEPPALRVIRYPAKASRNRETARRTVPPGRKAVEIPTPLSNVVPVGPVIVSAEEARQEQARRHHPPNSMPPLPENDSPTGGRTLRSLIAKLGPQSIDLLPQTTN